LSGKDGHDQHRSRKDDMSGVSHGEIPLNSSMIPA
jgi:hypothetical protein